jgi:uncharacterized membrane protein
MFDKYDKVDETGEPISGIKFTEQEIKDELILAQRWKHRLIITWISFLMILVIIFYIMFSENLNQVKIDGLGYFSFVLASIVLTFFGANTIENWKKR